MRFQKQLLDQAFMQTYADRVVLADGETEGAAWEKAMRKAIKVIESNPTITYENGVLKFISEDSFKSRVVTKDGCHESCECKGMISYHGAMRLIVARYFEIAPVIETATVKEMNAAPYLPPTRERKTEIVGGCRI